uniref:Proteasome subunit alpha type n=1 Tax=Romanomermis culicivorax TaxID=13658 RepID=A0A915JWE9_ROMCU
MVKTVFRCAPLTCKFFCACRTPMADLHSRRYDTRTTTFSPEGRLYQVEYAMEAINHAAMCIGLKCKDGILIGVENRTVHPLLDPLAGSEKIYKLNDNIACSVAGITSDANTLVGILRLQAARYELQNKEAIPVQQLVEHVANHKQFFTQIGGKRPFGVSMLYMGWDERHDYQMYMSDPSGNFTGWKGICIGANSQAAMSLLNQEYDPSADLKTMTKFCVKVLAKTLDVKISAEKIELMSLQRVDDKTVMKKLRKEDLAALISEYEELEKAKEAALLLQQQMKKS